MLKKRVEINKNIYFDLLDKRNMSIPSYIIYFDNTYIGLEINTFDIFNTIYLDDVINSLLRLIPGKLNWTNLLLAGGAVVNALMGSR